MTLKRKNAPPQETQQFGAPHCTKIKQFVMYYYILHILRLNILFHSVMCHIMEDKCVANAILSSLKNSNDFLFPIPSILSDIGGPAVCV